MPEPEAPFPRVVGLPPGADVAAVLAGKLDDWAGSRPPEALARVRVLVNTRRLGRRLRERLAAGAVRPLPRIDVVGEATALAPMAELPDAGTRIAMALELMPLVQAVLDRTPELAPRAAAFDLALSLAGLADDMAGEGVPLSRLARLGTDQDSGYWEESARFLGILGTALDGDALAGPQARRRAAVAALGAAWTAQPPETPVIVAGSTGSRRTTVDLMVLVANLPAGTLLLPGFDFDLPGDVWDRLVDAEDPALEEHPQFRLAQLLSRIGAARSDVVRWGASPAPERARLISLAMRPAPYTDRWLSEVPGLGDLARLAPGMTLIEAPTPRLEAAAIAIEVRRALAEGLRVAVVTTDRTLGRRVAAALSRWRILPDDSSGLPLGLSAPGRLMRLAARFLQEEPSPEGVIALLKHPLTASSGDQRGRHLRLVRRLEISLRQGGRPRLDDAAIETFAHSARATEGIGGWLAWLRGLLETSGASASHEAWPARLARLLDALGRGPEGTDAGRLWENEAGRLALAALGELDRLASGPVATDGTLCLDLLETLLAETPVRDEGRARDDVRILGTLEARAQAADLVILAGLNETGWPRHPAPDPWLNRRMRRSLGLLAPEREIGLAAHDFQNAASAARVVLTRARRDGDAETVPSRWLNRIRMLVAGAENGGPELVDRITARGAAVLAAARALDAAEGLPNPARRPAPVPPAEVRPRKLSVTAIETLIRDPYAIYARRVLNLKPLNPLSPGPDAALRGTAMHEIVERFVKDAAEPRVERLLAIADEVLAALDWPAVTPLWRARVAGFAPDFVAAEIARRAETARIFTETSGELRLDDLLLVGKADRVDILQDGRAKIWDYKTGALPTRDRIRFFDRQLPIEAAMIEAGAFPDLGVRTVAAFGHIRLARDYKECTHSPGDEDFAPAAQIAGLRRLIAHYITGAGAFPSRRAVETASQRREYDHLARFGEWGPADDYEEVALP